MVELGDAVRDRVTRFEGTVTGIARYLYGCEQACVVPRVKDGKFEAFWFDVPRLEIVGKAAVLAADVSGPDPGGPASGEEPPTSTAPQH